MKRVNINAIKKAVQDMVTKGEITFIRDHLIYHAKNGLYDVGKEDDILSVWNLITAYKSKETSK